MTRQIARDDDMEVRASGKGIRMPTIGNDVTSSSPPSRPARPAVAMRIRVRRLLRERGMWVLPTASVVVGAVVALLTLWIDENVIPSTRLPLLPISHPAAQTLTGGLAAASITATAVVFWVRGMLVSLASSRFAPRLLTGLLSDSWQAGATAVMTGLFGVSATAILGFPASDSPSGVPHLTLLVVLLWAATALVVIAGIIDASVRDIHGDRVVDKAVERIRQAVDQTLPESRPGGLLPVPEETHESSPIRATQRGWVLRIDEQALTRAGWTRVELNCQIGTYIEPGTVLMRASPPDGPTEELRDAIAISPVRQMGDDPGVGLRSLADTAVRAFTNSNRDTPTALAAVASLSVLLSEVLVRDGYPVVERVDDTVVIRRIRTMPEDLVAVAMDPLVVSDQEPASVAQIIRLFDSARESLEANGGRFEPLQQYVSLLVQKALQGASPRDRELVHLAARPWGLDHTGGTDGIAPATSASMGTEGSAHGSASADASG